MLIDKEIKINIKSSVIISKLNSIGIFCKMNDIIYLPIFNKIIFDSLQ